MGTQARARKVASRKAASRTANRAAARARRLAEFDAPGFTDKQQRFVEEYLVDFNASGAARRAGYGPTGKPTAAEDSALRQHAARLVKKPHIQAAIRTAMDQLAEHVQVNLARVVHELTAVALGEGEGASKVRALEILAKILGAFSDTPTVALTVNVNPQDARERIARRLALLAERN